jgi:hypothetical protein
MIRPLLAPALALLGTLAPAAAQAIIAQSSGLANPAQVIDFGANLYPNFQPVTTEFAGITISHASYFTTGVSNNLVGGFLTNNFSAGQPNLLSIVFAAPITDLSFVYHQISTAAPSNIRAMLQGVVVDSFSGTWNQFQTNNYFGFTNIVFDELQIDFQADFNVDTLAFNPAGSTAASCTTFNGTGVNPNACTCVNTPVLGTTWQAAIASTPTTIANVMFYAPGGPIAAVPFLGGELLVSPTPAPVGFTTGSTFAIPIPSATSWIGTDLTFQGLRLDVIAGTPTLVLLNGVYLVIGT